MTVAIVVWILACAGLWIAVRATAGRSDSLPVHLLALPLVLFVVVAVVPVESIRAIRAFQAVASQGGSVPMARVVELATGMLEPIRIVLWFATSVLVAAVAVSLIRRRNVGPSESAAVTRSRFERGTWVVASLAAGIGLVGALLVFVAGVPPLVMEAGEAFAGAESAAGGRLTPGEYADAISVRLIVGVLGGAFAALVVFLLSALVVATAGKTRRTPLTDLLTWPVVMVVSVLLGAGLVGVTRMLGRYAAIVSP